MPPIWAMCGFSVSIHSRSAPFCSEAMQSITQRSSPVPGRNWNRFEGRRSGSQQLALAGDQHIAVADLRRFDLLAIEEAVVLVAKIAGLAAEGDLLGQPRAERIGARDDDAVVDPKLEEGVADRADLGEEVFVRHRDLAVLVAALLLVGHLVLDLDRAGSGLDHLAWRADRSPRHCRSRRRCRR